MMNVKNVKNVFFTSAVTAMFFSGQVFSEDQQHAVNQGTGVIKFIGTIVDAPCSISPESIDQSILLGQVSNSQLEGEKDGVLRPFEIRLEDCTIDTAKTASVTFTGISDDETNTRLAIEGGAKGAAIVMSSQLPGEEGQEIVLGKKVNAGSLINGNNILKFGAKLVSNLKENEKATPGDFTATSNFIMSYQ